MAHDKILKFWMSFPALVFLILMGSIPILFPIFSNNEGRWFPVVKNIEVWEIGKDENGIYIDVRFDKVRSCRFLGISWFNEEGSRKNVVFSLNEIDLPFSRPTGNGQSSGPWYLQGVHDLEKSRAIVSHECHPLWVTYSNFYP